MPRSVISSRRLRSFLIFIFSIFVFFFETHGSIFKQTTISGSEGALIVESEQGRDPFLAAIARAQHSVALVMYQLSDPTIVQALIQAKARHIDVTVMLNPKKFSVRQKQFLPDDTNLQTAKQLESAGIQVVWSNPKFKLTHQKTLIIDDSKAFIMTLNFTPLDFGMARNFAVVTSDPVTVKNIQEVMIADLQHEPDHITQTALIWSPDNTREKLLQLVDQAQQSLDIYALELSDFEFIGHLKQAAERGVSIRILMPKAMAKRYANKLNFLRKFGVKIQFSANYYIHAKVIIEDLSGAHAIAYVGSANFTTASFDQNRELGILINTTNVMQQLENVFVSDWEKAATDNLKSTKKYRRHKKNDRISLGALN